MSLVLDAIISEKINMLITPNDVLLATWNVEQIAFDCEATSDPSVTLTYTWKQNGVTVNVQRRV